MRLDLPDGGTTRVTRTGTVVSKDHDTLGFWLQIQWATHRSFRRVTPAQWAQASIGSEVEDVEEIRAHGA